MRATTVVELPKIDSIASSVNETIASDYALSAIRLSRGSAASCDDQAIVRAVLELGREGIAAEPSSAVPIATLPKLLEAGAIHRGETIICVITGPGIRWPLPAEEARVDLTYLDGNLDGLRQLSHRLLNDL